jgi:hypothetical protein
MAGSLAIILGGACLLAASAASAACTHEGQRYPAGTVLCISGKTYVCESNDAWKIDRTSNCTS